MDYDQTFTGGSRGFRFETKIAALAGLRLMEQAQDFNLASNFKNGGKFDDIVFTALIDGEWEAWFIQLKHRIHKTIQALDLSGDSENCPEFALNNYYPSFEEIIKRYDDKKPDEIFGPQIIKKHFVIFTNAAVNSIIETRHKERQNMILSTTDKNCGIQFKIKQDAKILVKIINEKFIQEFLEDFQLCPNQCNEADMDKYLEKEIRRKILGLSNNELELVREKWTKFILIWSDSGKFLSKCKAEKNFEAIIAEVNLGKKETGVKFLGSFLEHWKKKLSGKVVYLTTGALTTQLPLAMLHGIGLASSPNVLLTLKDFHPEKHEFLKEMLQTTWKDSTLVIDCNDFPTTDFEIFKELKRCVLVATDGNQSAGKIAEDLKALRIPFTCNLDDLEETSQMRIRHQNIRFQDHNTDLSTIIDSNFNLIDASLLTTFLNQPLPEFGKKLSKEIDFYVPRTLTRKIIMSAGFFNLPAKSRFGLINSNPFLYQNHQIVHLNAEDFEKYAKNEPFHMFEEKNGVFFWRKSSKNIEEIREHLKGPVVTEKNENILQIREKIVVICGKPGMGKSTLLLHLAATTKMKCPNYWIIPIVLSEFRGFFNKKDFRENAEKYTRDLLVAAAGCDSKNSFFDYCYNSGKMIVLFDGFDEIHPYVENGLDMLEILRRSGVARVWVTTRPILRDTLEQRFAILSYKLKPFTEIDQKIFLKRYWKRPGLDGTIDEILKLVKKTFSEKFQFFSGFPLHTFMIAEVFQRHVLKPNVKIHLDPVKLFQDFLNIKLQAFLSKFREDVSQYELKLIEADREEKLMALALLAIVSVETCARLNPPVVNIEGLRRFINSGYERAGIVFSFIGESPQFIHRTFAEYYVAVYFSKNFETNREFLGSGRFFDDDFEFVRYFFDRLLAEGFSLHDAAFACDQSAVEDFLAHGADVNQVDRGGRTALHIAAALPDAEGVISTLLASGADPFKPDNALKLRPIDYAMRAEIIENIEPMVKFSGVIPEMLPMTWIGLLTAIRGDYLQMFVHLLVNGLSRVEDLNSLSMRKWIGNDLSTSLHILQLAAAYNAKTILKYLLSKDTEDSKLDLLEKRDNLGMTAVLWAAKCGHAESVQILINAGAELYVTSSDKKHVGVYAIETQNFDMLLIFLTEMRKVHLKPFKWLSDVVLQLINDKSDWALRTFSFLIATYPELATVTGFLNMNLLSAACVKGNVRIAEKLIAVGLDLNLMTPRGTSLHLAVHAEQEDVVRLLLKHGAQVNLADGKGVTPVFSAAERGLKRIFFLLIEAGADVRRVTADGENLASFAARAAQPDIHNFLINIGMQLPLLKPNRAQIFMQPMNSIKRIQCTFERKRENADSPGRNRPQAQLRDRTTAAKPRIPS